MQIDEPKFRFSIRQNLLPNLRTLYYMRLHGRNAEKWWAHDHPDERYNYLYTPGEIDTFADTVNTVRRLVHKIYVYMNNHFAGKAVANAAALRRAVGQEVPGEYTDAMLERYLVALRDAGTGRMKLLSYGETYEGRKLYLAVFSAPENLARLDEIKADIRRLADPRTTAPAEAERIAKRSPAVAWLSYGVHGNEASSMEAALNVMYQLASRSDEEILTDLRNLVLHFPIYRRMLLLQMKKQA